ncbi:hypothetical protein D9619_009638 [Psilocybe cf. subviscida]|uniref:PH domain-containing protein n=1 Tax=Psilocybe cf. subviscida TaxID=2480587 RepID=A0A8H5F6B8_9AGAR|nr:hypothetical protein D9619_009638 [Psilocybe cf. subviscida]
MRRGPEEDDYSDDNSLDEVDATLTNIDDELDDAEHALSEWSSRSGGQFSPSYSGSYSPHRVHTPTFSSATGTFTYGSPYSGYTGSPSFVSLPTTGATTTLPSRTPRTPRSPPIDPRTGLMRLSRITERTEESNPQSRPVSGVSILSGPGATRPTNPTPRSGPVIHSRGATDPSSDRTLPPPGRLSELRAVFESQPTTGSHSRTTSTPSYQRASSPLFGASSGFTATGTGTGYTGRRSVSPSKSQSSGSGGSYSTGGTSSYGSVLSPPVGPRTLVSTMGRSTTPTGPRTQTQSYTTPSYTTPSYTNQSQTASSYTNTNTNTGTWVANNPPPSDASYTATNTPATEARDFGAYTNTYTSGYTQSNTSITPPTDTRTYTNTYTDSRTYDSRSGTNTYTYDSTSVVTPTRTTTTNDNTLRRPQTSPRSPLASVRNIVALWKEHTPTRPGVSPSGRGDEEKERHTSPTPAARTGGRADVGGDLGENDGLYGIRQRVEGARARMREARIVSGGPPLEPVSQTQNQATQRNSGAERDIPDNASIVSGRSNGFPPGFDMNKLSNYAQSSEPPLHIGHLWYLNVHTAPPYRWVRCQALLYPHLLLLSWLSPGGGRGIVALDLLNCTSVVNVFGGGGLGGREAREVGDVGGSAAREQDEEMRTSGSDRPRLVDTLVPFHMLYADGVERLAAESLLERQKWVNRIWEAVNRPVTVPDSVSVIRSPQSQSRSYSPTRSPTGTILSIDTFDSRTTTRTSGSGSRSTVFVPPLHSLPDISDYLSNTSGGLSRQSSFVSASQFTPNTQTQTQSQSQYTPLTNTLTQFTPFSSSHYTHTVDDTVIHDRDQEYIYPGDSRAISIRRRSQRHSLRRTGSMTDLDEGFKSAVDRSRQTSGGFGILGALGGLFGGNAGVTASPVTISSGSSLGKDVFMTPPPTTRTGLSGSGSDRRSDVSDERFFSAGSSEVRRSNVSSTYFSGTERFTGGVERTGGLNDSRKERNAGALQTHPMLAPRPVPDTTTTTNILRMPLLAFKKDPKPKDETRRRKSENRRCARCDGHLSICAA